VNYKKIRFLLSFAIATAPKEFKQKNKKSSSFADYDMVQAETRWIKTDKYDAKQNT
jgi:hypothetical protein